MRWQSLQRSWHFFISASSTSLSAMPQIWVMLKSFVAGLVWSNSSFFTVLHHTHLPPNRLTVCLRHSWNCAMEVGIHHYVCHSTTGANFLLLVKFRVHH